MLHLKKILFGLLTSFVSLVGVGMVFADTGDISIAYTSATPTLISPSILGGSGGSVNVRIRLTNSATALDDFTGSSTLTLTFPSQITPDLSSLPVGWTCSGQVCTYTGLNSLLIGATSPVYNFFGTINTNVPYISVPFSATFVPNTNFIDTDTSNNTAITANLAIGYAGGLSKSASSNATPGSQFANQGDAVIYTLSYYNSGTLPLAVNFTDSLPQGFVATQAYSPLGSCLNQLSLLNGTVSINGSNTLFAQNCIINPGVTGTITVIGSFATQPVYANNTIINTVSAQVFTTQSIQLPTPSNATAILYGYPVIAAFSKQFTGALPQQLNDYVYYTVTITNSGSVGAQDIILTDTPPLGLDYVDSIPALPTPSTNPLNTNLSWTISVPAGTTQTYTLRFRVNNVALINLGSFTNTGTLSTGSTALSGTLFTTARQVTAATTVAGFPYVTLTKSIIYPNASGHVYQSGDLVTYQITVQNTGTWTATGVVVDTLPTQLTGWVSSLAPSSTNGSTWTWTGFTINPGQTRTILLTGTLNSNYLANTVYTNTSNFTLQAPTSGVVVNNGVVAGLVLGLPNLTIGKTMLGTTSQATLSGDVVAYQLVVTQNGTATYTGSVCITDVLPSQITYLTASLAPTACNGPLSWSGMMPLNGSLSLIVTGQLNTSLSPSQAITNTGTVQISAPNTNELIAADNTTGVTFIAGGSADMQIVKSLAGSLNGVSGSVATYTLNYTNNGPIGASGVVIQDVLPYPLVYSGQVSGAVSPVVVALATGTQLTWSLGSIASGQSANIIIQGYFSGFVATGTITNTARIASTTPDANLSNNVSTVVSSLASVPDVQITKSLLTSAQGVSGSLVSFQLTVMNNGAIAANNIIIQDLLPSWFSYLSHTSTLPGAGTPILPFGPIATNAQILESQPFNLAPGASGSITFTGYLNTQPLTGFTYTNTGIVTGLVVDGNPANNISTVSATVPVSIGCTLTKVQQTSPWSVFTPGGIDLSGQAVGYTITVTNNGMVPFSGLTITDANWPSSITRPTNLPANNIVASGVALTGGQTISFSLTGNLSGRTIGSLLNSATASFSISGTNFSCTGSGEITRVPAACNNGYLEDNEQCDTYNGTTYVFHSGSLVPFLGNSFSFDNGSTTQICNASCKVQTVALNNCASMTFSGATPSTLTGCVGLTGMVDPLLSLAKMVTPSAGLSSGSVIRYTITVTNTSSGDAYNVKLVDTFPWSSLEYIGNMTMSAGVVSVIVNTGTQSFSGDLGAMPAGATRTVSFDARIRASSPTTITNTAVVNYTNAASMAMPQLTSSRDITLGTNPVGLCGDGTKSSTEPCDLGNGGGVIGNYLDTTTNFPADSSSRGAICTSSCQIDNGLNICGDGKLGRLEMCDMQAMGSNSVLVGNYLNTSGTLIAAGVYANTGYSCNSSCELTRPNTTVPVPACWAADSVISVMEGESLPVVWDIDFANAGMVNTTSDCTTANRGTIIKDTMNCTVKLYNKNEESDNTTTLEQTFPCNASQVPSSLFNSSDNKFFIQNPYGSFLIDMTESLVNEGYGEYKVSLDRVNYRYCNGANSAIDGNPYARVCQVNVAVTRPYLMQKTNTVFKPSDPLDDFFVLGYGDKTIVSSTQFDKSSEQTKLSSLEYKGKIQTLTQELLNKYDKIAVKVNIDSDVFPGADDATIKKVPGKSIYILQGKTTDAEFSFAPGDNLQTPTTIIVKKGDLVIQGSVESNMMILVPNGSVRFELGDEDSSTCDTQIVRGIVIAKEFVASEKDIRNTRVNIDANKSWCSRGNLHVYGALYGDDIDLLVQSRRSELEGWFTYKDNFGLNSTPTESRINAYRRDLIYKGASVYIEQNPDLWRAMPPGADTFLNTLNVSRN